MRGGRGYGIGRCAPVAALVVAASIAPALQAQDLIQTTYVCERGVEVPVVYINDGTPVAVIYVERRMVVLPQVTSASGARYAEETNSGYVWWSKGDEASLAWFDAEARKELTLHAVCEEVSGD